MKGNFKQKWEYNLNDSQNRTIFYEDSNDNWYYYEFHEKFCYYEDKDDWSVEYYDSNGDILFSFGIDDKIEFYVDSKVLF